MALHASLISCAMHRTLRLIRCACVSPTPSFSLPPSLSPSSSPTHASALRALPNFPSNLSGCHRSDARLNARLNAASLLSSGPPLSD